MYEHSPKGRLMLNCTLYVTCGLPRSGKTTWAGKMNYPIVNPDSIRLAMHGQRFNILAEPFVWAVAQLMVRALFLSGHSTVIVDATNTTKKRRDMWKSSDWDTKFVCFGTSIDTCLARAANDTEMIKVIERMAEQFEQLDDDEIKNSIRVAV